MESYTDLTASAFDIERVQPGDVLFSTTPERTSSVIRRVIGEDISHAMVCVAPGSVIDSTPHGVHARSLARMVLEPGCAGHVLRSTQPLSAEQLAAIIAYARSMVGTRYTIAGAGKSVVAGIVPGRRQFCSRLVAQAYRAAGIALANDADFCHPGELLRSALLMEVQGGMLSLTPEQADDRRGDPDRLQGMRDVTNALLDRARALSPGIESLNDIDEFLIAHPAADMGLVSALTSSGYLEEWNGMVERHPWIYDLQAMDERPRSIDETQVYCTNLLADEAMGPSRFMVNRANYVGLHTHWGLQYFALLMDLYTRLGELHAQRVRTATSWLERHGFRSSSPKTRLRPHTPQWFESLRAWDPKQAAMTQAAIAVTGRADVCSVCADEPAADYALVQPPAAGPGTLRLCDFCFHHRSAKEPMVPYP